jgi:hypothetical protein
MDLEKLKFVIESIPEITLKDIPTSPSSRVVNGVELPPTNQNMNGLKKEKEEV